jgi:uncharacterized protein (DUF433 family)
MSELSYSALGLVLQNVSRGASENNAMTDLPWIDPREIDDLAARYPSIPRSRVELALEAYWPVKDDVEAALLAIVARQERDGTESLDYTMPSAKAGRL